eukprot:2505547-Prymnesium_polylepis.1
MPLRQMHRRDRRRTIQRHHDQPAVARSLSRSASSWLLSRCLLPVSSGWFVGSAAPAWRLHRRTD